MISCLANDILAQAPMVTWESIGQPFGGPVHEIVGHEGVILSANLGNDVDFGTVHRSVDGGESWSRPEGISHFISLSIGMIARPDGQWVVLTVPTVDSFLTVVLSSSDGNEFSRVAELDTYSYDVIAPNESNLMMGTHSGILGSQDRGQSWASSGLENQAVFGLSSTESGYIVAATDSGVYRSGSDDGEWEHIGLDGQSVFRALETPDGFLYAGTDSGMYVRSPDSTDWDSFGQLQDPVWRFEVVANMDVIAASQGRLLRIRPHETVDLSPTTSPIFSVRAIGEHLWITSLAGVFRYSGTVDEWHLKGVPNTTIENLLFTTDGGAYAGSSNGVFRSADGGDTWSDCGLRGKWTTDLIESEGRVVAGTQLNGGAFEAALGTCTWDAIPELSDADVWSLAIGPDNVLYLGTSIGVIARQGSKYVPLGLEAGQAVAFTASGVLCVANRDGIWKRDSEQGTWERSSVLPDDPFVNEIVLSGDVLFGSGSNGLYRSEDDGESWVLTNVRVVINDIEPLNSEATGWDLLLATRQGIEASGDKGSSTELLDIGWPEDVDAVSGSTVSVSPDGRVIAGATSRALYRSSQAISTSYLIENPEIPQVEPAIWPNPTRRFAFVRMGPSNETTEIVVYDVSGRLMSRSNYPPLSGQLALDLSGLAPGLALIVIREGSNQSTHSLIVVP